MYVSCDCETYILELKEVELNDWSFVHIREIHPLDPQPHRHSMLVPTRVCVPRVTQCSLGKYWSRDWFHGNFSLTQGL